MKKISVFLLFLTAILIAYSNCIAKTNDLDLMILQDPEIELKKAIKEGSLAKAIRAIELIEQRTISLDIFKDPALLKRAFKEKEKSNCYSKKYLFFSGTLWSTLAAILLFPGGVSKKTTWSNAGSETYTDYSKLMIKLLCVLINVWFLKLTIEDRASMMRDARLINQLVKKYHQKSIAN